MALALTLKGLRW